jgi:hypothetical protein
MALWGTADSLYSIGTVSVNYANKEVTGSGTSFTAAGISTGDVITIGSFGSAVISGITSDTLISIATTQYLTGATINAASYVISEKPVFTLEDSNYSSNVVGLTSTVPTHNIYGVDANEIASLEPGASGIATQYGGIHAGWVGIHTYVDMHGNLRVKSETLVAMSEITGGTSAIYSSAGDANDDSVLRDVVSITINSQPQSATGIGTTQTATFSVTASVIPTYASLAYQWQFSTTGIAYTSLVNGGGYSGVTSPTLTVANDNDKNNVRLRVIVNSGDVSVTSGIATITY